MGNGHLCYNAAYVRVLLKARLILEVSKEDVEVTKVLECHPELRHQAAAGNKARERKVVFHKLINGVLHHCPSFVSPGSSAIGRSCQCNTRAR